MKRKEDMVIWSTWDNRNLCALHIKYYPYHRLGQKLQVKLIWQVLTGYLFLTVSLFSSQIAVSSALFFRPTEENLFQLESLLHVVITGKILMYMKMEKPNISRSPAMGEEDMDVKAWRM